jgi:hydroxyethylthiazole kinase-like uncharacterized protein yjeF
MKILSPTQLKEADNYTIENEPISSVDLMERAATKCFEWFIEKYNSTDTVAVFCGIGNNGGDGLALSRMLLDAGWRVKTYVVEFSNNYSLDFTVNYKRLEVLAPIKHVVDNDTIPDVVEDVVVDAIFGVGLSKPPRDFTKDLIENINRSNAKVVSIDMPSGLYVTEKTTDIKAIVKAQHTLTFQSVKLSLLLPEYSEYSGEFEVLDIGLLPDYLEKEEVRYHYTEKNNILKILKKRKKFSHKGTFGHSLLVGGSSGKIGAILLATKAAVKSGSGLVTSLIPKCGYQILQTAVPEAMVLVEGENNLESLYHHINPSAIGIGPGLGTVVGTTELLKRFFEDNNAPLVIDADALNLISTHRDLLAMLPEGSVLTPHPKEFERLVGRWNDDFDKLKLATEFAINYQIVLVLKGANTAIFTPDGNTYFNSTGNSGLATGGSGDVLTGIITSLISQGYNNVYASILGVYLHGLTSEIAITKGNESLESFSAMNIIDYLGRAFNTLKN